MIGKKNDFLDALKNNEAFLGYLGQHAQRKENLRSSGDPRLAEQHLSGEELYDYALGWVDDDENSETSKHLRSCPICSREVLKIIEVEEKLTEKRLEWANPTPALPLEPTPGILSDEKKSAWKVSLAIRQVMSDLSNRLNNISWPRKLQIPIVIGRPVLVSSILIGFLVVSGLLLYFQDNVSHQVAMAPTSNKISVLCFENRGDRDSGDPFAAGLTEHVISKLAQISDLTVTPFRAMAAFKGGGDEYRKAGHEYGSRYVLVGEVTSDSSLVHVTAKLFDVLTGAMIWTEPFDRKGNMAEIFSIQGDIIQNILGTLGLQVSENERKRVRKSPTENVKAYNFYMKGRYHYWKTKQANNDKAIAYFKQALDADPNYALAYAGLASCYSQYNDRGWDLDPKLQEKALKFCQKAISLDPDLPESHHARALVLLKGKLDFTGAIEADTRAIELSPSYHAAYHTRSIALFRLCRYVEAMADSERCLQIDPTYSEAVRDIGRIFERQEAYEKAVQYGEKAYSMRPDIALNLMFLSRFYTKAGRYDQAEEILNKLVKERPNRFWSYDFLARLYVAQRRYEDAEIIYDKILTMAPNSSHALSNIADFYNLTGKYDLAEELLNQSLMETKDDRETRIRLCSSFFQSGETDRALECSDSLLDDFPNEVQVYLTRGQILLASGAFDEAEKLSTKMINRFEEDPLALDFRGRILFMMGRDVELRDFAQEMITTLPDSSRGYNLLAVALSGLGQIDEALRIQEHALTLAANDPETVYIASNIYELAGKLKEAESLTEQFQGWNLNEAIANSRIGDREDKLFWMRGNMGFFSNPQ